MSAFIFFSFPACCLNTKGRTGICCLENKDLVSSQELRQEMGDKLVEGSEVGKQSV